MWIKVALYGIAGLTALNVVNAGLSGGGSRAVPAPPAKARPQTEAEKKNEQECQAWLLKAAAAGLIPPAVGVNAAGGEFNIIVNRPAWDRAEFEVKQGLVDAYECLLAKGRDERVSLSVLDSKTHRAVAYYNGLRLRVE